MRGCCESTMFERPINLNLLIGLNDWKFTLAGLIIKKCNQRSKIVDFLKKYQVTERGDGFWSVFAVEDMKLSEVEFKYLADASWNKFATAAEAQELADELNKEVGYESNNNA